jgi:sec-independent protein translocase protein TatC
MTKYIIEIKYRTVCILIVFFTFIPILFIYKFYIIHFFLWINPNSLNYFILTSITELFNVFFDISFFIIKYILYYFVYYHIVSFLALGLYEKEYKSLKKIFMMSLFLWALSTSMFLSIFLPLTFDFFFDFQKKSTETLNLFFEPKIEEYFSLILSIYSQSYIGFQLLLVFAIFFEYAKTNLNLIKNLKKFIYIFILLVATIITPPDMLNQILFFIFFVVSLEIHIFCKILKENIF